MPIRSKTLTQTPVEKQPKAQNSPSKNTSHAKRGNTGIPTLTRTRHTRRTLRHPPPQESFGPSVTANCEAALSPYQPQAPKRPIRLKTMTQTPVEKQPKAQSSPSKKNNTRKNWEKSAKLTLGFETPLPHPSHTPPTPLPHPSHTPPPRSL